MAKATVSRTKVERGITKITRAYPDGSTKASFQIRYGGGAGGLVSDTFSTAAKARAALARARAEVMDGDHVNPALANTKSLTVAQDWVASHPDWKERTRKSNQWTVDVNLAAFHGARMKQITTAALLAFRFELLTTPKWNGSPPAASSVRRTMGVVHSICEHARLTGHLASNPCLDLPKVRSNQANVVDLLPPPRGGHHPASRAPCSPHARTPRQARSSLPR